MKKTVLALLLLVCLCIVWANGTKDVPYQTVVAAGVTFNYRVTPDMNNLDCQLIGTTTGWVAVGFIPVQGMQSSNLIIGYDQGGVTHIRDDWGTGPTTHASDTSLGGSNNIIVSSSSETTGTTQLNFTIPLNSGDNFDRVLGIGQAYSIILGRGQNGTDNFTGAHQEVAASQITITEPVGNQDEYLTNPAIGVSAYPNPFRVNTSISFLLKSNSTISISIFNTKGQIVKSIPSGMFQKGENQIIWNGRDNHNTILPNGIYFCQVYTGKITQTLKLALMR